MSPKYRGNSDDWLDSAESARRSRSSARSKKGAPQASSLPGENANATVMEVFPRQCRVRLDQDEGAVPVEFLCSYRRAQVLGHSAGEQSVRERSPVAVGDRVLARQSSPDSGVIDGVCERRNSLIRPAPGRDSDSELQHVVAANLDILVIVAAAASPEFAGGLVDRYWVAAQFARIPSALCVTKMDLVTENDSSLRDSWSLYRVLGLPVFEVCAKSGQGISELREFLKAKRAAFCGHSGVGKTSLLRTLIGREVGRVGVVSDATGKGRHTTSSAIVLDGPENSLWIDTPGVREFGLAGILPEALHQFFPEFHDRGCQAPACRHLDEAECAVKGLPRYTSYRRIHQSLMEGEH
jgi:ribosome biogenesis GTPase